MIYEIRGEVFARLSSDDPNLKESLIRALGSRGATVSPQERGTVVFRGPWLVPSWNVLAPISQGEINVEPCVSGSCRVQYRLSLFRVRLWCAIFTLIILLFLGLARLPVYFVLCAICVMWVWLYGGNWVLTTARFHGLIEKTLADFVSQTATGSHAG